MITFNGKSGAICFRFLSLYSAKIHPLVTVLSAGTFYFCITIIVLVYVGIHIPTPSASRLISFENEYHIWNVLGPFFMYM